MANSLESLRRHFLGLSEHALYAYKNHANSSNFSSLHHQKKFVVVSSPNKLKKQTGDNSFAITQKISNGFPIFENIHCVFVIFVSWIP